MEWTALRTGLVRRAGQWRWCSLSGLAGEADSRRHPGATPRGDDWVEWVNQRQSESELAALRRCIERGAPYGSDSWQRATARRLDLEASLRPRDRPKSNPENQIPPYRKAECLLYVRFTSPLYFPPEFTSLRLVDQRPNPLQRGRCQTYSRWPHFDACIEREHTACRAHAFDER
jgi:hypothetical protein